MITSRSFATLLTLALLVSTSASAQLTGTSIGSRWSSPSTLTSDQAAGVLAREARGETVSASQLFEARKYLRTDGPFSLSGAVVRQMGEKLLRERLDPEVRIRALPTIISWLDHKSLINSAGKETLRLRGEALQLTTANLDPNLAATTLVHLTFHEDWTVCSGIPCRSPLDAPVRSSIGYDLVVPLESTAPGEAHSSELILASGFPGTVHHQVIPVLDSSRFLGAACNPLPSSTHIGQTPPEMGFVHLADRTQHGMQNWVLCGFFALDRADLARFTYSVDGTIARPPAAAGSSAVVNNPLSFTVFE